MSALCMLLLRLQRALIGFLEEGRALGVLVSGRAMWVLLRTLSSTFRVEVSSELGTAFCGIRENLLDCPANWNSGSYI